VVSHGCLVVDGTDGGVHMGKAVVLAGQDQAETMPQGILDFDLTSTTTPSWKPHHSRF
jgi:hypothetical protein